MENQKSHGIDISKQILRVNISFGILTLISVILLLMAAMTEPGIIPRHIDMLMESIPPMYRDLAEKQESRKRYIINKKRLVESQNKQMARNN
jgi:F0F1-type ATP synthase membrane subunit a